MKPLVKERLEELKEKTGLSINYYVNYAVVKQLLLDSIIKHWEYDNMRKPDPHYEYINKMPDEVKFCDGDSCEVLPFNEKTGVIVDSVALGGIKKPNLTDSKLRGEK